MASTERPRSCTEGQRRAHVRYPVDLRVELSSGATSSRGQAENLSVRGVFLATDKSLQIGQEVDVTITLPSEEKIVARGIARWLRDYLEEGPPSGAGIEFVDVQGEEALLAFLRGSNSMNPESR